jgi:hypothetical protein
MRANNQRMPVCNSWQRLGALNWQPIAWVVLIVDPDQCVPNKQSIGILAALKPRRSRQEKKRKKAEI